MPGYVYIRVVFCCCCLRSIRRRDVSCAVRVSRWFFVLLASHLKEMPKSFVLTKAISLRQAVPLLLIERALVLNSCCFISHPKSLTIF